MLSVFILGVLICLDKFVLNLNIRNLLVTGHYIKIIILLVLAKIGASLIFNPNYEQQLLGFFGLVFHSLPLSTLACSLGN